MGDPRKRAIASSTGPAGIAFDRDGNLLVVDGLNGRIQRWTKEGRFLGSWGNKGTGDGEFNMPWGITVDREDNVYVADWRNDRVQKLDRREGTWRPSAHQAVHRGAYRGTAPESFTSRPGWPWTRTATYSWPTGATSGTGFLPRWRLDRHDPRPIGLFKMGPDWFHSNQDLLEERDNANLHRGPGQSLGQLRP